MPFACSSKMLAYLIRSWPIWPVNRLEMILNLSNRPSAMIFLSTGQKKAVRTRITRPNVKLASSKPVGKPGCLPTASHPAYGVMDWCMKPKSCHDTSELAKNELAWNSLLGRPLTSLNGLTSPSTIWYGATPLETNLVPHKEFLAGGLVYPIALAVISVIGY